MRTLRLSTALSLLLGAAGLTPVLLVLAAGWLPLHRHLGLWTLPSVERALDASLAANRATAVALRRVIERQALAVTGQSAAPVDADSTHLALALTTLAQEQGFDLVQYYRARGAELQLAASASPRGVIHITEPATLPFPESRPDGMGPHRPAQIEIRGADGSWLGIPVYLWRDGSGSSPVDPDAALVVGVSLGPGYYPRLEAASEGLLYYRRFEDLSRVLRTTYAAFLGVVILCVTVISLWLARRVGRAVSTPVERLAAAMESMGAGGSPSIELRTRFREIEALAGSFARMNDTLREYEQSLREAEQVRGARDTARFVAHEIRNSLTPVQASLAVLDRRVAGLPGDDGERATRALELIRAETQRMERLASTFSEYAHLPEPHPERVQLPDLIEPLVREEIPARIEVRFEASSEVDPVFVDRDEMLRAFRNLLRNAVEATSGAGRIAVVVGRGSGSATVRVTIEDTGVGMDGFSLAHVFQPGYTTKIGGSGLGLALVRRTVIRYGGTIRMESAPGRGTRCTVELPTAADRKSPPAGKEQGHARDNPDRR